MDEQLLLVVVIISAIAVGLDANTLDAGKHHLGGMADTSAIGWAAGTLLLWIVVLPLYLITRPKLVAAHKADAGEIPIAPLAVPQRRCAVCEMLYDAQYDRCPQCAKA